jgi:hypothetical protein
MKDILYIGGPMDGAVQTVPDECYVMHARVPQPFTLRNQGEAPTIRDKTPTYRYIEVPFVDQLPYSIFRLDTMLDTEVLPRLLAYYAKGHERARSIPV